MRSSLVAFALAVVAGCACSPAAAPPPTTAKPPPRLVIWADSHGDEPTDWPAKLGCADQVIAHIGWAIADQGPISPPPLTDQIDTLSKSLRNGDQVVVALGANDLIDFSAPFAADVRVGIEKKITARGATAIWTTLFPRAKSYGPALDKISSGRFAEWNRWVLSRPAPNRVDLAKPLGASLDDREQIGDGVHLTPTAQHAVAAVAKPALCT